jgi:hypothetical protein
MNTRLYVGTAIIAATFAAGASAAYLHEEAYGSLGYPLEASTADEGVPQNLVASLNADEGVPQNMVIAMKSDEGVPLDLVDGA